MYIQIYSLYNIGIISCRFAISHSHVNRIITHIHRSQGNRPIGTSLIMFIYTFCGLVLAEVRFFHPVNEVYLSTFSFICVCIPAQP